MTDPWIVFNVIAYTLSALVMLGFVIALPGWYKLQYLLSVVVFIYYACVNYAAISGVIVSTQVTAMIRPISPIMPMQLLGSAALVYVLLKELRRRKQEKP